MKLGMCNQFSKAIFLMIALVLMPVLSSAAVNPVLNFSDLITGPDSGLGDGKGSGVIVTVWGQNLGSSQGASTISFVDASGTERNAAHVYYWKNADGEVIDQISEAMELIKNSPDSRRILVSSWNVGELKSMALQPCHAIFQFYVANGQLSCQLYQRSADIFLGVPFNIASYALLTHMVAQQCNLEVGDFVWSGGDCHVYSNHFEQVNIQLGRTPKALPRLIIKRKPNSIFDYQFDDFEFYNYIHDDAIKAPVAI